MRIEIIELHEDMPAIYSHRQIGTPLLLMLGALWIAIGVAELYAGLVWIFAGVTVLLAVGAVIFSSMTIRVTGPDLEWSLGFGLFRRRFPLSDIASIDQVTAGPLTGLGARSNNLRDWLWIVSGTTAVTFRFVDGRTLSLGTDDPDNLVAAINRERAID